MVRLAARIGIAEISHDLNSLRYVVD